MGWELPPLFIRRRDLGEFVSTTFLGLREERYLGFHGIYIPLPRYILKQYKWL
jgi:hypothetical protein